MAIASPFSLSILPSYLSSNRFKSSSSISSIELLLFSDRFQFRPNMSLRRCQYTYDAVSTLTITAVGEDLPHDYGEWFPKADPADRRRAGVLLHPTSFRGPYGIGDLGEEAYRFIDWLHVAGCSVWQVFFFLTVRFLFSSFSLTMNKCV